MKYILSFVFAFLLLSRAGAQVLGHQEYRKRVILYNQDVKAAGERKEAASLAVKSARTNMLPFLSANGSASYQFFPPPIQVGDVFSINQEGWSIFTDLSLMQPLYAGGAISAQNNIAAIQERIAGLDQNNTIENTLLAADAYYWNFSASQEILGISNTFYGLVDELYTVVNARFEDGMVSRNDLIMVETRKKEAEFQVLVAERNYETAQQALNIFMGAEAGLPAIADSIRNSSTPPDPVPVADALNARFEYQMSLNAIGIAEENVRLTAANFNPNLSIGLQETFGTKPLNTDNSFIFNTIAMARISIPIFEWNNRRFQVGQARLNVGIQELENARLVDEIVLQINQALTNLELSRQQTELAQEGLQIATENLDLNYFSYYEGRLPILDVLSAQMSWAGAQSNLVSANLQYKLALSEYQKAAGLMYAEYQALMDTDQ
jgi:outer membrane protein